MPQYISKQLKVCRPSFFNSVQLSLEITFEVQRSRLSCLMYHMVYIENSSHDVQESSPMKFYVQIMFEI